MRQLVLLALLAACTTVPLATIPDPLPEALAWEVPDAQGAFLGLRTEENDRGSLDELFFEPGVRVLSVVINSPAARAGLRPGDVVLTLDGVPVDDPGALEALLGERAPDSSVRLEVQRDDTVFGVPLTLVAREGGAGTRVEPLWRKDPSRSRAAWATASGGVRLVAAADDSPFPRAGVPLGSLVSALDGQRVLSDRDLIRRLLALPPGQRVRATYRPPQGDAEETAVVRLVEEPRAVTRFNLLFLFDYEASVDGRAAAVSVLDLWLFELFQYRREGPERRWVLLELFGFELFGFSRGIGELE